MQWVFPEDSSVIVLGAVRAEDEVHACPLVLVHGEGWEGVGLVWGEDSAQSSFTARLSL